MANKRRGSTRSRAQREAVKYAKSHKKGVAIFVCTVIVILLAAALVIYFCFPDLWKRAMDEYAEYTKLYYGDSSDDDPAGTDGKKSDPVPSGDRKSVV